MKKNIIILATIVSNLLILNSCDDFLDKKPVSVAIGPELPIGGLEAKVFGLYGKMRNTDGITNWTRYWFQSIRSDDASKGSDPGDAAILGNIFDNFQYTASTPNDMLPKNWTGHFSLIYDCNDVISDIKDLNLTEQANIINAAEARAIRAFAYFDLRRDYGELPIIDNRVVNPSDAVKAKSSIQNVEDFIQKDLEFADQNLPSMWSSDFRGRATKGMAKSYLAKLFLYKKNWQESLKYSQEVINLGVYSLHDDYQKLFTEEGDESKEVIWEVQLARVSGVNYSNSYWESQGIRGQGIWDLGWGFNVPTQNLINAYEINDKRKAATILEEGTDDGYGNTFPTGLSQKFWNKKAYTNPELRTSYGENKNHWINIKLMRYADVILMAAEASNELGQTQNAINYINQIRKRAGLANTTAISQNQIRDAIKHERRIEFALEGERFYDLVRWGDANAVLGNLGYQPRNEFYPIPQEIIDKSGNIITQNPNY